MKQPLILIAEDDQPIREGLNDFLQSEGYATETAKDGREALEKARKTNPQLIVLDIMMPELNGFEVCKQLRESGNDVPILYLTAKTEEMDQVLGLRLGGDDYVTKPFGLQALLARVEALMRRTQSVSKDSEDHLPGTFTFGPVTVDRKRYEIQQDGKATPITARELALLELFHRHPGEVMTRDKLLRDVWGVGYHGTTRTLDQHIAQLRKKIEPDSHEPKFLLTAHGIGYSYQPPE